MKLLMPLGGTFAFARLCEVQPPTVSQWLKGFIPRARIMYVRVVRSDLNELIERHEQARISKQKGAHA